MPAPFTRHRRSREYWDSQPSRSAEVLAAAAADPEPVKRAPAPKDTRHWCKGKRGRAHVPVLVDRPVHPRDSPCQWGSRWSDEEIAWRCRHREECQSCGKILREPWQLTAAECPLYPGSAEQKAQAAADAEASRERWETWRLRRRPVITGPQEYRRKRQEAS